MSSRLHGTSYALGGFFLAMAICAAWTFIGRREDPTAIAARAATVAPGMEEDAISVKAGEVPRKQQLLQHDFGLLRPGDTVAHQFVVRNDSKSHWTLRSIQNSCNCTVVSASRQVIAPNESAEFELRYKAGGGDKNDQRRSTIHFEEAFAPQIALQIRAIVRERLSAVPAEVIVHCSPGSRGFGQLEIENYSDTDWSGISVEPSASAIIATSVDVFVPAQPDNSHSARSLPRGTWRVTLEVDSSAFGIGHHRESVRVTNEGGDTAYSTVIPLMIRVRSPVAAAPSQFFFGALKHDQVITKEVVVHFGENVLPADLSTAVLTHDMGGDLELAWSRSHDRFCKLAATYRAPESVGIQRGLVRVEFPGTDLPTLSLAVLASVEPGP